MPDKGPSYSPVMRAVWLDLKQDAFGCELEDRQTLVNTTLHCADMEDGWARITSCIQVLLELTADWSRKETDDGATLD